jgi:hypothetical protein
VTPFERFGGAMLALVDAAENVAPVGKCAAKPIKRNVLNFQQFKTLLKPAQNCAP